MPAALLRFETFAVLWATEPCIRILGFFPTARLFRRLGAVLHGLGFHRLLSASPECCYRLVERQAEHALAPPGRCLTHAVTLHFLLAQQGHASDIRLGVQNLIGGLRAHAWVEVAGQELASRPISQLYVPLTNA